MEEDVWTKTTVVAVVDGRSMVTVAVIVMSIRTAKKAVGCAPGEDNEVTTHSTHISEFHKKETTTSYDIQLCNTI